MTAPLQTDFVAADPSKIAGAAGRLVVFAAGEGRLEPLARRVDRLTRGAIGRLVASDAFAKAKAGSGHVLAFPPGLAAEAVLVVKLPARPTVAEARLAGAAIAGFNASVPLTVLAGAQARVAEVALGLALRAYEFRELPDPGARRAGAEPRRDLPGPRPRGRRGGLLAARRPGRGGVPRPRPDQRAGERADHHRVRRAADRPHASSASRSRCSTSPSSPRSGCGRCSRSGRARTSPSKVVVMQWKGGGDAAPLALCGKGVVFDTGGISIKPAAGMEEMTMDMGGAAVVAGVMRTLALRKAPANVVGLVGLVENMPDGNAQRPGDVVRSMKGDTVEVINTDAEGRLVLADVLWYAQDRFKPAAVVDLATLTGAIIIALGHEKAGVFANDDALAGAFLAAAEAEGEGAWRMPLAPAYDKALKSRIADIANVGGRPAGSITAAQFLQRFVKEGTPWMHLDIAGVAYVSKDGELAPKGATGWGVRALDRLVRDRFEG